MPHAADRTFFYGINFEFSHHAKRIDGRELDLIEALLLPAAAECLLRTF